MHGWRTACARREGTHPRPSLLREPLPTRHQSRGCAHQCCARACSFAMGRCGVRMPAVLASGSRTCARPRALVCRVSTDAWASAAPLAPPMWSLCPSCGAWAALTLWQRFEFSRELPHLREAWPLLRGTGLFFEGVLRRKSAQQQVPTDAASEQAPLQWGPSHSPENAYLDGNGSTRFLSYDGARCTARYRYRCVCGWMTPRRVYVHSGAGRCGDWPHSPRGARGLTRTESIRRAERLGRAARAAHALDAPPAAAVRAA
jgi:hypothetical protein